MPRVRSVAAIRVQLPTHPATTLNFPRSVSNQADPATAIVRTDRLTKTVPSGGEPLTILDHVSISVAPGESVAIVGASGSGKTTLLGLIAGLDVPTSGEVWLRGRALHSLDEDARARLRQELLGFVFQSFQLLPALTALENVMLPLELAGAADPAPTAREWLGKVGLKSRAHHYPRQLSGGEQQRVAIARAFSGAPALLLADEPTGNLDAATGREIADLMFELNHEHGTTLVLVTHDERLATRCDRRIGLAGGSLVGTSGLATGAMTHSAASAGTILDTATRGSG
jgi:putative ABC transport system ATP-binding protein